MQVSVNGGTERGLYPHNTPPGVWIMLKSSTESERGLYPLWIILSVGFETDIDLLFVSLFVLQCPLGPAN